MRKTARGSSPRGRDPVTRRRGRGVAGLSESVAVVEEHVVCVDGQLRSKRFVCVAFREGRGQSRAATGRQTSPAGSRQRMNCVESVAFATHVCSLHVRERLAGSRSWMPKGGGPFAGSKKLWSCTALAAAGASASGLQTMMISSRELWKVESSLQSKG